MIAIRLWPALCRVVVLALGVAGSAQTATAGGLFIPGWGPQSQGRAGAFVAKADNPMALAVNPAGLAKQTGWQATIGVHWIDFRLDFQRAGTYDATGHDLAFEGSPYAKVRDRSKPFGIGNFAAVPNFAITGPLGDTGVRIAVGLFTPTAYADRDFDTGFDLASDVTQTPPPQRYDIVKQSVLMLMPSVGASYQLRDDLDIGARISVPFASIQASTYLWGIRNYEEWVGNDGYYDIDVSDNYVHSVNIGVPLPPFAIGALWRPSSALEVGASYRSPMKIAARGTGTAELGIGLEFNGMQETIVAETEFYLCGPGGTPTALASCLELSLPQSLTLGARWVFRDLAGDERADIELDLQWEDWSNASDIRIIVDGKSGLTGRALGPQTARHGYRDTLSVRLGGSYRFALGSDRLTVLGGVAYDTAAAPDNWSRVDQDGAARATVSGGAMYSRGPVTLTASAGVVVDMQRVARACNPVVADPGCPSGSPAREPGEAPNGPDPIQPLSGGQSQVESPFNAGRYDSHYIVLSTGISYRF